MFDRKRREFIMLLGGAAAWPLAAHAEQPIPRIGLLTPEAPTVRWVDGLRDGLKKLGYVEGRTIAIEYRWADGHYDKLPLFAAELVRLNVDIIVAFVTAAALAAHTATKTIPIVIVGVADPIGTGLIASLARPGGNVTGTSSLAVDLVGKQFELIKGAIPQVSRIAVLWNPDNAVFQQAQLRQAEEAARLSGFQLRFFEARAPTQFDGAFAAMRGEDTHALVILADPLFVIYNETLAELALKARIPAIGASRIFAAADGFISYGPSYYDLYKRAAAYVDKILKGAKPGDLPVEQPTQYELVVNLKTATALGLSIPPSLLARADEVIE